MKVSVVVLTLNAGLLFEDLLARLAEQEGDFEREVVVVDSGSTDGTVELARRHGARVHGISKEEFDHGATRNLGVSLARGEYVALTVQDAVPLDARWLAAMVEDLERDGSVAGVYGRQVPRPTGGPLARAVTNSISTADPGRREQFAGSPEGYRSLPPEERRRLATFDNVNSCVRRSVWERFPFEATSFGEDLRWGAAVVAAGHKLVYEPGSAVVHSHERGVLYDLRRNYVSGRLLEDLFGLRPVPNLWRLLVSLLASFLHVCYLIYRELSPKGGRPRAADVPRIPLLALKHVVPAQAGVYLGGKARALAASSPWLYRRLDQYLGRGV